MYTLYDAEPDSVRDSNLVKNIQDKTTKSFSYLLKCCESTLNINLTNHHQYIATTLSKKRCNGLLYALHDYLYELIKVNDIHAIIELIENIDLSHCISESLDIVPLFADKFNNVENRVIYTTAQKSHDTLYAKSYDCKKPEKIAFLRSKQAIEYALKQIEILDPDCYFELKELITDIVICDSNLINAGTCFNTFGFLYVRQLNPDESWLKYFEHLVHEAGHHHLYTVLAKDPLIKNVGENQYFASPLRREKRPLNGIYQAMFVLARTIRAFNFMKANSDYNAWIPKIKTHYNNANNDSSFNDKFNATYSTIKNNALLTDVGSKLLNSCYKLANY